MRWLRWVRCAAFGALLGELVALAAVIFAHFDVLPDWMMLEVVIPICILVGAGIGTVFAYRRPVSLMDAARIAETRLGLKERLSSALEFEGVGRHARDPIPSILVQLQQRDAAVYAGSLRPKDAVPFKWPWQLKALIGMTVVLILALIVPNLPMFVSPAQRNERGIVSAEAKKLEQAAKIIDKQADAQQLPHTKWAAQQMKRLAQQMSRGRMDKRQAFVKYGKLTQQMQNLRKQMAGQNGADATKSLSDAGRELAKSLQSQSNQNGQPSNGAPKSPQSGQGGNGANANGSSKTGASGKNQNGQQHGFNVPGFDKNKTGGNQSNNQPSNGQHASSEMQQAAKAMQQGDTKGLSQQLRQLAQKAASGQMSQQDKQQAAQDLQKLADALKGTPMNETQKHAQAAADAMKQGDTQRAADEMKKAADSAEREMKNQQDRDAMRDAQNSLQKSQNEMAGASSPSDVNQSQQSGQQQGQNGDSGQNQGDQNGQNSQGDSSGDQQGNGQGKGQGQNSEQSAENEMKSQGQGEGKGQGNSGNQPGQEGGGGGAGNRAGRPTSQHSKPNPNAKGGKFQGPPGRLNPNFDPSKFPKYNKIYLGKPKGGSNEGRLGKTMKTRPGPGGPHPVNSRVPYYDYVGPAKQAAEHAVDHEDIPPSYQGPVRKYFDSLTPSH
jgi:hypothetical protein